MGVLSALLWSGGVCADVEKVLTPEEIWEYVETGSTQLRAALTAVDEAEQQLRVAKAGLLPDIDISLNASYLGNGFTTARNMTDYQQAPIPHLGTGLTLGIDQPLYTGGALTAGIELARLQTTSARYQAEYRRDNIRFELTGLYLEIYKYSNLKQVVTGNIEAARRLLSDMRARYEQGTVLQNDITRYELQLSNLELQLLKINNSLEILNTNLVERIGLPAGTVVVPDSTILDRSLPVQESGWWQKEALSASPVLNLARTGVEMSRKAETVVRAERLPKVGLQAGWSINGPILTEIPPINRNLSYWYVGVGVNYNLSALYKTNRSVARSRLGTRKAVEELAAAEEDVLLSVNSDYVRYMEAYQELMTQQKCVELAERNYHTINTRYMADMALITDMLDAANARLAAEQQLVNARISVIYYYYKLLLTTGQI